MAQGKDPLLNCLKNLQDLFKQSADSGLILSQLELFRQECSKDLSHKVLAGKEGAYPLLLDILDKYSDDNGIVIATLECLNTLMDGMYNLFFINVLSLYILTFNMYNECIHIYKNVVLTN